MRFYGDEVQFDSEDWFNYSFGENLRSIRRNEEMTMKELSEKSNVSQSYISQLENNVRLPSDKVIDNLALALAKGKTVSKFQDTPYSLIHENYIYKEDTYVEEFILETRQQDFKDLLTRIKNNDESKKFQKSYLETIKSNNDGSEIKLTKDDIDLVLMYNSLDIKSKQILLDFLKVLSNKTD